MRMLFGTSNEAKIDILRGKLVNTDIELVSPRDLNVEVLNIVEANTSLVDNARTKAETYYDTYHIPTIACDEGLYIDGLDRSKQPGLNIRTVNGKRLTDEEMLEYYSNLAKSHNGKLIAYYKAAIYIKITDELSFCSNGINMTSDKFLLVGKRHPYIRPGYPLDSLSVDIETNKYFYDINGFTLGKSNIHDCMIDLIKTTVEVAKCLRERKVI